MDRHTKKQGVQPGIPVPNRTKCVVPLFQYRKIHVYLVGTGFPGVCAL